MAKLTLYPARWPETYPMLLGVIQVGWEVSCELTAGSQCALSSGCQQRLSWQDPLEALLSLPLKPKSIAACWSFDLGQSGSPDKPGFS